MCYGHRACRGSGLGECFGILGFFKQGSPGHQFQEPGDQGGVGLLQAQCGFDPQPFLADLIGLAGHAVSDLVLSLGQVAAGQVYV